MADALYRVTHVCDQSRGTAGWWQLFYTTVVFAVIFRLYMAYRKQVKAGNLFGKVDPFKHPLS